MKLVLSQPALATINQLVKAPITRLIVKHRFIHCISNYPQYDYYDTFTISKRSLLRAIRKYKKGKL